LSISTAANTSTIDRIRQIHGSAVANELIDFNLEDDRKLGFKASGLVTNANYHVKRTVILLFINHRSVESSAIRKAVEQTYSTFLPKGGHPFAYIDLEIEPHRVDVNIHPTKREVNFLNEDEIIEAICSDIRSKLAQVDSSRTFMTQTLLPGVPKPSEAQQQDTTVPSTPVQSARKSGTASIQKQYENNLVRTDSRMRKITSMLPSASGDGSNSAVAARAAAEQEEEDDDDDGMHYESTDREPLRIDLTSVKSLRAAVRSAMHIGLTEMFATHTYVGLVDERRRIAAVQAGVKLYLVDYGMVCNELFYQIGLTDFGNFGVIKLDPPPKLVDLLRIGTDIEREEYQKQHHPTGLRSVDDEPEDMFRQAPKMVTKTLIDRRDMLDEYFSLQVTESGELLTIPLLLKNYVPSLAKLPRFLLRLGPYINWTSEEDCFRTFIRELAAFYTPEQLPTPPPPRGGGGSARAGGEDQDISAGEAGEAGEEDESITTRRAQITRMLEHVVFPAIRTRLVATSSLLNGVVEVADLKSLYRVFERC
jgi:DNA mismatch repair protein MLH1